MKPSYGHGPGEQLHSAAGLVTAGGALRHTLPKEITERSSESYSTIYHSKVKTSELPVEKENALDPKIIFFCLTESAASRRWDWTFL